MKKRFMASAIALGLSALLLAGCAGDSEARDYEDGFTIGIRFPTTIDQMQQQTIDNVTELVEAAGGNVLIESSPLTPEASIQAFENLISAGVDGIMIIPAADSVLPRVIEMTNAADIPWTIYFRSIMDDEIRESVLSQDLYLGNTFQDEYLAGYELTRMKAEAGIRNIVLFSTALGDTTGEQREAGMQTALDKYGMRVINEFRAVPQASDARLALESVITTYPDVDGIFLAAGALTPGILPALTSLLEEHDRTDIKITLMDFPQGLQEAFADGHILAAIGGHNVTDPIFSATLLVNYLRGTPLSVDPVSIRVNQIVLTSEEDVINYFNYFESGVSTFTAAEAREKLFRFENPNVTIESVIQAADGYTLESVMNRR